MGSAKRDANRSSSSPMTSPDTVVIIGPSGSSGVDADRRTACPCHSNDKVQFLKSHRIGPRDSSHWTPRTILYDPRVKS
jgi:hypothetical protein